MRATFLGLYAQDSIHLTPHLVDECWPALGADAVSARSVSSRQHFLARRRSMRAFTARCITGAPAGSLYYGDPGVSSNFTSNKWNNFSPRVGLVWDPKGDGKQTFRAGFGVMYDAAEVYLSQHLASNPPYVNELDFTISNPAASAIPGPSATTIPAAILSPADRISSRTQGLYTVLPQNLHTTYVSQWNSSYQRQLGKDWLASFTYLGNRTTHLYTAQELNPGIYTPGETSVTYKNRILYYANPAQGQYYGDVSILDDGASANYNGLLTSVQHRFSQGFTLLTNYTWSHCISNYDFTTDMNGTGFLNPYNLSMDRGDCNYDIRHIFNASIVALSYTKGNTLLDKIVKNWQFAPLVHAQSGAPLNITTGEDNSLAGTNTITNYDRPNLIARRSITQAGDRPCSTSIPQPSRKTRKELLARWDATSPSLPGRCPSMPRSTASSA